MSTAVTRESEKWHAALWAHPEWWVVAIGVVAWLPIVRNGIAQWGQTLSHPAGAGIELLQWQVMVLAMMAPVIAVKARAVALRSLGDRRHRAIAEFLVSYLAPWSALGLVAVAARQMPWSHSPAAVVGLSGVATAWAILPLRERAMVSVHGYAPVMAPEGWEAVRDCTRSGLVIGTWCVVSCWPLMLVCAISGHDLAAVAVGGAIGLAEIRSFRPPRRFVIVVTAALTVFFAVR